MKIQLQQLKLMNFKGVRDFTADFQNTTFIHGANASGKTTMFDAFLWLLFGKDSTDRKDFEIKTLDASNKVIEKLNHEVGAVITVDGQIVRLRRVYKEKWVKRRGSEDVEFKGNETEFFWNDVPLALAEYQKKISAMVDENLFKLITNTLFFNNMKWQDRRTVLLQIAGNISTDEILATIKAGGNNADFSKLVDILSQGKTLAEYKLELANKKKRIKNELEVIPTRIDEATRSMPEQLDFDRLEIEKTAKVAAIGNIDIALTDASKALKLQHEDLNKKQNQLQVLKDSLRSREYAVRDQYNDAKRDRERRLNGIATELQTKTFSKSTIEREVAGNNAAIESLELQRTHLRESWHKVNDEVLEFTEGQFACPACKQPLAEADAEAQKVTLTQNFNKHKSERLEEIQKKGTGFATQVTDLQAKNVGLNTKLELLVTECNELSAKHSNDLAAHNASTTNEAEEVKTALANDTESKRIALDIEAKQQEIENATPTDHDNTGLLTQKAELSKDLELINRQLDTKVQIEKTGIRIEELKAEEKALAKQMADFEKAEFYIDQYNRAEMDTLEQRINGRFKIVKFKLFDQQINGGEAPCCDVLIDGVPFTDTNNAARVNAGVDIINTLSMHYDVFAPIFVDNRESISELIDTYSQVINLVVSPADKKLRVAC